MEIDAALSFLKQIGEPFAKLYYMPESVMKGPSEKRSAFMEEASHKVDQLEAEYSSLVELVDGKVVNQKKPLKFYRRPGFSTVEPELKVFWIERYENEDLGEIYCAYLSFAHNSMKVRVQPSSIVVLREVDGQPKVVSSYAIVNPMLARSGRPERIGRSKLSLKFFEAELEDGYDFKKGFGKVLDKFIYFVPQTDNFEYVLQCFEHFDVIRDFDLVNRLKSFSSVSLPESFDDLREFVRKEFKLPSATIRSKTDPGPSDFFYKMVADEKTPVETKYMLLRIIKDFLVEDVDEEVKKQSESFFQWGSATYGFADDVL